MLKRFLFSCLVAAAAAVLPARATTVMPLNLVELTDIATTVFQGVVIQNRTEREGGTGMIVTYTKFRVVDVLKGSAGPVHEIKQIGGELDGEGFRIMGVPKFEEGREYVIFLTGRSSAGFSSPVGLSQGRFNIRKEGNIAKVGNGRDFKDLAGDIPSHRLPPKVQQKLSPSGASVKDLDLDDFKQLVRDRVAERRGIAGSVR